MKIEFVTELEKIAAKDKKVIFLTGDLGFHAFEGIRSKIGDRFINAGVAEQNMISVAAGLSSVGLKPWAYSISTFLTLKTVEQVRNDICHLNLPVKLAGFGGGYGYGIMGESHHLLEDIAIYSSFPQMKIYVPAFSEDVATIVRTMHTNNAPSYLRLNLVPKTTIKLPRYAPTRQLMKGNKMTIIALGPLIHHVLDALSQMQKTFIADVFSITELPFGNIKSLLASIEKTKNVLVIEEHTNSGGLGEKILSYIGIQGVGIKTFTHHYAKGYLSELYGNHSFHQKENKLDTENIAAAIRKISS